MKLLRTHSDHLEFLKLVRRLDAELAIRDGDDHAFYHQFNHVDKIKYVVVAFENARLNDEVGQEVAIGCGAIKEYDAESMEVKRMYTPPEHRGKGIAVKVLGELEKWAEELGYKKCILETGKAQPEAIALYTKCGYSVIANYGQYAGVDNSVCFEKKIS